MLRMPNIMHRLRDSKERKTHKKTRSEQFQNLIENS
jgi:hypothetical protein